MKDLDPMVFLAVLHEMLGPVMWTLIISAGLGVVMFVVVLLREQHLDSYRLVRAQCIGILGGLAALVFMAHVTHSGFTDAGGPIDWLLIGVIFGAGMVGTTLLVYAGWGCCKGYFSAGRVPK